MDAMGKMVASLLGVSPTELGEMATNMQGLVTGINERLERIEAKLDAMKQGSESDAD